MSPSTSINTTILLIRPIGQKKVKHLHDFAILFKCFNLDKASQSFTLSAIIAKIQNQIMKLGPIGH